MVAEKFIQFIQLYEFTLIIGGSSVIIIIDIMLSKGTPFEEGGIAINTTSIAKEWGCSPNWVRERCSEKMIPLAEKKGPFWDIPIEANKPPCTRHYAVILLELVVEASKGTPVQFFPGKNYEKSVSVYKYLSEWSFISEIKSFDNPDDLEDILRRTTVTERGKDLISVERNPIKKYDKKTMTQKIEADLGPIAASYQVSKEKQL